MVRLPPHLSHSLNLAAAAQTQGLHSLGLRVKGVGYEKNETGLNEVEQRNLQKRGCRLQGSLHGDLPGGEVGDSFG